MEPNVTHLLLAAILTTTATIAPGGDEPPKQPDVANAPSSPQQDPAIERAATGPAEAVEAAPLDLRETNQTDAESALANAERRLAELKPKVDDKKSTDEAKTKDEKDQKARLRGVVEDRIKWINQWLKDHKERESAEHPETSPEKRKIDLERELEKTKAQIKKAASKPESVLPSTFVVERTKIVDAKLNELKDAVEQARIEAKDRATLLEKTKVELAKGEKELAALKIEREKAKERVSTLNSLTSEKESAIATATTPEAIDLARELFENHRWELLAESERLAAMDAKLSLASALSGLGSLQIELLDTSAKLARTTADQMDTTYKGILDGRRVALEAEAAKAQSSADRSIDPLKKHEAKRTAELLELEAQNLRDEQRLATNVYLSPREQKELSDRATREFDELKQLVKEGRSRAALAVRLKHEFRKLATAREAVVSNELARAGYQLAYLESELTAIEFELMNDSRDDEIALEVLLENLPKKRWEEAKALCEKIEGRHRQLLEKRRSLLEHTLIQADNAHKELLQRVKTLEEKYNFIQGRIFWVRDSEPLGPEALGPAKSELIRLFGAVGAVGVEFQSKQGWRGNSVEFWIALAAVIVLPLPMARIVVLVKRRLGKSPTRRLASA